MKKGAYVRPSCRNAESSNIFKGKCLGESFFHERCKSRVYPSNFIENGLQHRGFLIWVLHGNSF